MILKDTSLAFSCSGSLCIWCGEFAYKYMEAYLKSSGVFTLEERFFVWFPQVNISTQA